MLHPFARPLYVMLKPAGAACNLACRYCYYLEKSSLYHGEQGRTMSDELLDEFTRQYLEAQTMPQVLFTWHGGEPLLRPLSFYQKALELQRRYARGRQIDNCLQTNGTLLTDEWCRFFKENHFLIGISIDGTQQMHDEYRRHRTGQPSWSDVMRGIGLLQRHGVEWNAMATVNAYNAQRPQAFYHFFRDMGCEYLQFTPVVEREHGRVADYSVAPRQWGDFLCTVYDEWVCRDVGRVFVQTFDATLANWAGVTPGVCSLSNLCGHAAAMEWNGDVYSCDHYVFPEYRLGNIRQQSLTEMLYGERQARFSRQKQQSLPRQCRECRWLLACHGECPKNRFATDRYGQAGLNYLCEGYRQYFCHVAADMDYMKGELDAGRAPANIMETKRATTK
ncbi:MAG: anaerobic sulfatase-maturation protein [Prevotella sp.]|nr:anaerobic sulfatase-maturation protein [Prevotella sp.]